MFSKPFYINSNEFYVTASAGIAICPTDGTKADILIKNADIAMYSAKDKGKNQYVLCDNYMKEEIKKLTELSNSLYRALENNELLSITSRK